MIVFLMTVPIKCKNSPSYTTTFHLHFVKSDESTRHEFDADQGERPPEASDREPKRFHWPLICDSHKSEVAQFMRSAQDYLKMCEESVRPVRTCNKRGRTNCWIFFRGLFGAPKQMGHILAKTFDGEQRWI